MKNFHSVEVQHLLKSWKFFDMLWSVWIGFNSKSRFFVKCEGSFGRLTSQYFAHVSCRIAVMPDWFHIPNCITIAIFIATDENLLHQVPDDFSRI